MSESGPQYRFCQLCGKWEEECVCDPQTAKSAYWERLKKESQKLGWRGEYAVVGWLRKRGWFAKRSFGSWGVDVFAAKFTTIACDCPTSGPNWIMNCNHPKGLKALLIDAKTSFSEPYPDFQKYPPEETLLLESARTGVPAVRAACLKGKPPRFFWYSNYREVSLGWFE